ncbi:hypothetical protein GQ607_006804 [Colletotrichum asianum]|uniref:Secreted protein n=1 Tax=Colletotrichum asianum TaxID=702518 RepID=A0A8H3WHR7_9PEZI|nr:hypothetical protein GQ607_006804 [Colletotrichum asianum]
MLSAAIGLYSVLVACCLHLVGPSRPPTRDSPRPPIFRGRSGPLARVPICRSACTARTEISIPFSQDISYHHLDPKVKSQGPENPKKTGRRNNKQRSARDWASTTISSPMEATTKN